MASCRASREGAVLTATVGAQERQERGPRRRRVHRRPVGGLQRARHLLHVRHSAPPSVVDRELTRLTRCPVVQSVRGAVRQGGAGPAAVALRHQAEEGVATAAAAAAAAARAAEHRAASAAPTTTAASARVGILLVSVGAHSPPTPTGNVSLYTSLPRPSKRQSP